MPAPRQDDPRVSNERKPKGSSGRDAPSERQQGDGEPSRGALRGLSFDEGSSLLSPGGPPEAPPGGGVSVQRREGGSGVVQLKARNLQRKANDLDTTALTDLRDNTFLPAWNTLADDLPKVPSFVGPKRNTLRARVTGLHASIDERFGAFLSNDADEAEVSSALPDLRADVQRFEGDAQSLRTELDQHLQAVADVKLALSQDAPRRSLKKKLRGDVTEKGMSEDLAAWVEKNASAFPQWIKSQQDRLDFIATSDELTETVNRLMGIKRNDGETKRAKKSLQSIEVGQRLATDIKADKTDLGKLKVIRQFMARWGNNEPVMAEVRGNHHVHGAIADIHRQHLQAIANEMIATGRMLALDPQTKQVVEHERDEDTGKRKREAPAPNQDPNQPPARPKVLAKTVDLATDVRLAALAMDGDAFEGKALGDTSKKLIKARLETFKGDLDNALGALDANTPETLTTADDKLDELVSLQALKTVASVHNGLAAGLEDVYTSTFLPLMRMDPKALKKKVEAVRGGGQVPQPPGPGVGLTPQDLETFVASGDGKKAKTKLKPLLRSFAVVGRDAGIANACVALIDAAAKFYDTTLSQRQPQPPARASVKQLLTAWKDDFEATTGIGFADKVTHHLRNEPKYLYQILPMFSLASDQALGEEVDEVDQHAKGKGKAGLDAQSETKLMLAAGWLAGKIHSHHDDKINAAKIILAAWKEFFGDAWGVQTILRGAGFHGSARKKKARALVESAYAAFGGTLDGALAKAVGTKRLRSQERMLPEDDKLMAAFSTDRASLLAARGGEGHKIDHESSSVLTDQSGQTDPGKLKKHHAALAAAADRAGKWLALHPLRNEVIRTSNVHRILEEHVQGDLDFGRYFLDRYTEAHGRRFVEDVHARIGSKSYQSIIFHSLGLPNLARGEDGGTAREKKRRDKLEAHVRETHKLLGARDFDGAAERLRLGLVRADHVLATLADVEKARAVHPDLVAGGTIPSTAAQVFLRVYLKTNDADFILEAESKAANIEDQTRLDLLSAGMSGAFGISLSVDQTKGKRGKGRKQVDPAQYSAKIGGAKALVDKDTMEVRPGFDDQKAHLIAQNLYAVMHVSDAKKKELRKGQKGKKQSVEMFDIGVLAGDLDGLLHALHGQAQDTERKVSRIVNRLLPDERDAIDRAYRMRFGDTLLGALKLFGSRDVRDVFSLESKEVEGETRKSSESAELALRIQRAVKDKDVEGLYEMVQGASASERKGILADGKTMNLLKDKLTKLQYTRVFNTLEGTVTLSDMLHTRRGITALTADREGAEGDIAAWAKLMRERIQDKVKGDYKDKLEQAKDDPEALEALEQAMAKQVKEALTGEMLTALADPNVMQAARRVFFDSNMIAHFRALVLAQGKANPTEKIAHASRGVGTDEDSIYKTIEGMSDEERAQAAKDPDIMRRIQNELSGTERRRAIDLLNGNTGGKLKRKHWRSDVTYAKIMPLIAEMDFAQWSALRHDPVEVARIHAKLTKANQKRFRKLLKLGKDLTPDDKVGEEMSAAPGAKADERNKAQKTFYQHQMTFRITHAAKLGAPALLEALSWVYNLHPALESDDPKPEVDESSEGLYQRATSEEVDLLNDKGPTHAEESVREKVWAASMKAVRSTFNRVGHGREMTRIEDESGKTIKRNIERDKYEGAKEAILGLKDPAEMRFDEEASQFGGTSKGGHLGRRMLADTQGMKAAIASASDLFVLTDMSNLEVLCKGPLEAYLKHQRHQSTRGDTATADKLRAELRAFRVTVSDTWKAKIKNTTHVSTGIELEQDIVERIAAILGGNSVTGDESQKGKETVARAILKFLPGHDKKWTNELLTGKRPAVDGHSAGLDELVSEEVGGFDREVRTLYTQDSERHRHDRGTGLYNRAHGGAGKDYDLKMGTYGRELERGRVGDDTIDEDESGKIGERREEMQGARTRMITDRDFWTNVVVGIIGTTISLALLPLSGGTALGAWTALFSALIGAGAGALLKTGAELAMKGGNSFDAGAALVKRGILDTGSAVLTSFLQTAVSGVKDLIAVQAGVPGGWSQMLTSWSTSVKGSAGPGADFFMRGAIAAGETELKRKQSELVGGTMALITPAHWRHGWKHSKTRIKSEVSTYFQDIKGPTWERIIKNSLVNTLSLVLQDQAKVAGLDPELIKPGSMQTTQWRDNLTENVGTGQVDSTTDNDNVFSYAFKDAFKSYPSRALQKLKGLVSVKTVTDQVGAQACDWLMKFIRHPERTLKQAEKKLMGQFQNLDQMFRGGKLGSERIQAFLDTELGARAMETLRTGSVDAFQDAVMQGALEYCQLERAQSELNDTTKNPELRDQFFGRGGTTVYEQEVDKAVAEMFLNAITTPQNPIYGLPQKTAQEYVDKIVTDLQTDPRITTANEDLWKARNPGGTPPSPLPLDPDIEQSILTTLRQTSSTGGNPINTDFVGTVVKALPTT